MLAVKDQNIRVMAVISRESNEKLKKVAKEDSRSVSNLIGKLINDYLESHDKD